MTTKISEYEQTAIDFLSATNTTMTTKFLEFGPHFQDDKESRNIWQITLKNDKHKYSFKFGSSIVDSCEVGPKIYSKGPYEILIGYTWRSVNIGISTTIKTTIEDLRKLWTKEITIGDFLTPFEAQISSAYAEFDTLKQAYNKQPIAKRPVSVYMEESEWMGNIVHKIKSVIAKLQVERVELGQAKEIVPPTAYDILACITKYDCGTLENFCGEFGYDVDSRKAYKTYKAVKREWENIELLFTTEQIEQLQDIN